MEQLTLSKQYYTILYIYRSIIS